MKPLIVISFLFLSGSLIAQPNWIWAKASDVQYDASGTDVVTDSAGNIYVAGNFSMPEITFDTITLSSQGADDLFVAKYDPDGNVVWAKNFGGTGSDRINKMTIGKQGDLIIYGVFNTASIIFGDDTLINHGDFDIFLVKMDTSGNPVWAKSIYSINEDAAYALEVDNDNNILVSGHCNNLPDVYFDTLVLPTPNWSFFLAKYNYNGDVLWAKNYGVSIYGLCIDSINEILMTGSVGGQCTDFGTDTLVSIGCNNIFIAKLDSNGNPLRARSFGGTDNDEGKVVKCSETGSIYLAGNLFSPYIVINTDTFYNPGITQQICTITMKLDTAFNILWHDEFATLWNVSNDIALGMKDELYLLAQGPYYSFVSDLFLLKYDTLGNLQWVKVSFLSEGAGVACDISKKGALVVTGGFRPPVDLDGFYLPSFTNPSYYPENFFLAKLDTLCGIPASLNHAEICSGDSTTLTVSGIGNYLWSTGDTTASITVSPAVTSTYTVTVTNDSCRGVAYSPVWVHPNPLTPSIYLSGDTLFSDSPNGNQWYKEPGGIISGATDSVYMPGTQGYYYVIVTNEYGCISDSSNHVYFTNVSVSELSYDEYFIIYPNPTTNQINFTLPNNEDYEIVIFNALSSNVTSSGVEKAFGNGICTINISYLPPGIYFIEVRGDKILRGRFVKE